MFDKGEENFNEEQLVWAKVKGHAWWPGWIHSINKAEKKPITVSFIGENNHGYFTYDKIKDFQKFKNDYITKCKTAKFQKSVIIADKIISGEIKFEEQEKYFNLKKSDKAFQEPLNEITKDSVEKNPHNNMKIESQDQHEIPKVLNKNENNKILNTESHELLVNYENSKENFRKNSDSEKGEEKLLNQKRQRVEETRSKSSIIEEDSIKKVEKHFEIPSIAKKQGSRIYKKKTKTSTPSKENKINPQSDSSSIIQPKSSPNLNSRKCSEDSNKMCVDHNDSEEKLTETNFFQNGIESIQKSLNEKIILNIHSLKLRSASVSKEVDQIQQIIKNIDECLENLHKTDNIDSKEFLEIFRNFNNPCQLLIDTSHRIGQTVNTSMENSRNLYKLKKSKENSSLIGEIEKLQEILCKQSSDKENKSVDHIKNSNQNTNVKLLQENSCVLKYSNLYKFVKEVLSEEFKMDFPKEMGSLESFSMNVINGNYLTDFNSRLKGVRISNEKEKIRKKIKFELKNILSRSVNIYNKILVGWLAITREFFNKCIDFLRIKCFSNR